MYYLQIIVVVGDQKNPDDIKNIVEKAIEHFGQIDILVRSASYDHYKLLVLSELI